MTSLPGSFSKPGPAPVPLRGEGEGGGGEGIIILPRPLSRVLMAGLPPPPPLRQLDWSLFPGPRAGLVLPYALLVAAACLVLAAGWHLLALRRAR